jgi:hypothetical protein
VAWVHRRRLHGFSSLRSEPPQATDSRDQTSGIWSIKKALES